MNPKPHVLSSLVAAVIAAVAWTVMALIFDAPNVALWAVIFAVGTFVVTLAISTVIANRAGRTQR